MSRPNLLVRLWRALFCGWPPLAPQDEAARPELPPIRPVPPTPSSPPGRCAQHCPGQALGDPRCEARNCTRCCFLYCPAHRCGKRSASHEALSPLEIIADLFRGEPAAAASVPGVPQVVSILTCRCGQKNRVSPADFGRGPVCGRCRKNLVVPS